MRFLTQQCALLYRHDIFLVGEFAKPLSPPLMKACIKTCVKALTRALTRVLAKLSATSFAMFVCRRSPSFARVFAV